MPTPVGDFSGGDKIRNFLDSLAPGGKYFKYSRLTAIVLGVISISLLSYLYVPKLFPLTNIFKPKEVAKAPSGFPEGFPLPSVYPLPHGTQEWKFSHGDEVKGPKVGNVIISPLDPSENQKQTVTVSITHDSPVLGAVATVFTDNKQVPHPLKLKSGSPTQGVWEGSWELNDSYNYVYYINFIVGSATSSWEGALSFR